MEKNEVYDRPKGADGTYFYRPTLTLGEGRRTTADMHKWTRWVMAYLDERAGACAWVA